MTKVTKSAEKITRTFHYCVQVTCGPVQNYPEKVNSYTRHIIGEYQWRNQPGAANPEKKTLEIEPRGQSTWTWNQVDLK